MHLTLCWQEVEVNLLRSSLTTMTLMRTMSGEVEADSKRSLKRINGDKMKKYIALSLVLTTMLLCSCQNNPTKVSTNRSDSAQVSERPDTIDSIRVAEAVITEDMAYQGVSNYCHEQYDWSVAEDNPSIMYVQMGEETETEYQVLFRSYTGAFVYFYVDKSSGTTRLEEYMPSLDVKEDAGSINLFDYLKEE